MSLQVVQPRIRGFISLSAHPDGCAANVREQVEVIERARLEGSLGTVLVIGSTTGYGLASALVACFGYGAKTLGVGFEKAPEGGKTGTAGWYNAAEASRLAAEQGRTYCTINGDAFSDEVKREVVDALRAMGPADTVIYSLAAPRRRDPDGTVWNSALKPIGEAYHGRAFDLRNETVTEASIEAATPEEIEATVKVMGGEDWLAWMRLLSDEGLIAPGARAIAYSYIGPEVSAPIYRRGTIGKAKEHLEQTAPEVDALMRAHGGAAWVSVNKSVVTQASSAIPAVPLYMSVAFRVMKAQGVHEGVIEQIVRLFKDHAGPGREPATDEQGRIRLDDREMADSVQTVVAESWDRISTETMSELADWDGYKRDFQKLFGFGVDGIDYDQPSEVDRPLNAGA
ncbi:MAG: trans-2-enoyl-CoA reductase family protein [Dehalococcoidia bacterium]|nr:trans-2-enoyl-CoA reductase family protein [Dehalococcoidia bacterium]